MSGRAQFSALFIILHSCTALKIAISETTDAGAGHGSGAMTPSQRTALNDATGSLQSQATPGTPAEATVSALGRSVRAKVEKDTVAQFTNGITLETTADEGSGITETSAITISAASAASISTKIAAGMTGGAAVAQIETIVSVPSAATGEGVAIIFKGCTAAGACETVELTGLSTCFTFTMPKADVEDNQCGFVNPDNTDEVLTTGVSTQSCGTDTCTCCTLHTTDFKTRSRGGGGGGSAHGDPKVSNLHGERFEILQLGTFSLLTVSEGVPARRLSLDATIDRAGEMCGATYIKNLTMTGSWMQTSVRVRAASEVVKLKALEVAFGGDDWIKAPVAHKQSPQVTRADKKNIHFDVHGVQIKVSIDAHRIRKNGIKTNSFANFLNVNVDGLHKVRATGANLGGLLAYDDHSFAMTEPDECKKGNLMNLKQKIGEDEKISFVSSMSANE